MRLQGSSEQLEETSSGVGFTFLLAIVLVYMILASQFNSYSQPLIIMVAQPLAIIGGVAALAMTGTTLNLYSMVGLILLIGILFLSGYLPMPDPKLRWGFGIITLVYAGIRLALLVTSRGERGKKP